MRSSACHERHTPHGSTVASRSPGPAMPLGSLQLSEAQHGLKGHAVLRLIRARAGVWLLTLFVTAFVASCGNNDDDNRVDCVLCNAQARANGIGSLQFQNAGNDSTARQLISACGFQIHNNHNGGFGDTLQVGSCIQQDGEFGIILVWAFNEFSGYRVCRPGFQGEFFQAGFTQGCKIVGSFFRP